MRSALLTLTIVVIGYVAGVGAHAKIELVELTSGLDNPVGVVNAGDGSGRLFIVGQRGSIFVWDNGFAGVFLDIEDRVSFSGERGLLGLAFHPDYENNGAFFVHYSNKSGDTTVSRFSVTLDPDIADPTSEQILLVEDQPFSNHNGGQINFGPDGYLYIGLGDGGSANDPGNRAQDLDELLGKILRIDVDSGIPYGIPASNPFVGVLGRDEIWAYGLRNPWRFSFDRETGDLFIGDVGQNQIEEIDFQLAASAGGENYGWRRMEGSDCFDPPQNCNNGSLILPILEYEHFGGGGFNCSVTGGYRYRGDSASIQGLFIYGDYCSGKIWGGFEEPDGSWGTSVLLDTTYSITSFGEDEDGELYMVEQDGGFFSVEGGPAVDILVDEAARNNNSLGGGETHDYKITCSFVGDAFNQVTGFRLDPGGLTNDTGGCRTTFSARFQLSDAPGKTFGCTPLQTASCNGNPAPSLSKSSGLGCRSIAVGQQVTISVPNWDPGQSGLTDWIASGAIREVGCAPAGPCTVEGIANGRASLTAVGRSFGRVYRSRCNFLVGN